MSVVDENWWCTSVVVTTSWKQLIRWLPSRDPDILWLTQNIWVSPLPSLSHLQTGTPPHTMTATARSDVQQMFAKEKMLHKLSFLVWIVVQKFAHPAVLWKVVNVCLIPPFFFFLMALKRWRQWIEFQMERLKRSRQARCFFNCSNFQFLKFFFSFQSFR